MRLIHSTTHLLKEFYNRIPNYAILSHTWGQEEVSLQEFEKGQELEKDQELEKGQEFEKHQAKHKAGYTKIKLCCEQAKRDGFEYVWIDTCCIDKTSSAELSEAINSMFQWYKEAQVCYAYLDDVTSEDNPQSSNSAFGKSRWFTRGWTLQELIAPWSVEFYGKDWHDIGTKLSLQKIVSAITGIPTNALNFHDMDSFSVAQRMSWAANRQTTRVEDRAYSLMGLFGVNMPMLYGEGERAFGRLQEEIMKTSDDHSLFAWTDQPRDKGRWTTRGLLANSPAEFVNVGDIRRSNPVAKSAPYSMTNKGLRIELPILPLGNQVYFAFLNCQKSPSDDNLHGIFLKEHSSAGEEMFSRIFTDIFEPIRKGITGRLEKRRRAIYAVGKNVEDRTLEDGDLPFRIFLDMTLLGSLVNYHFMRVYAGDHEWLDLGDGSFQFYGKRTCVLGALLFETENTKAFVLVLGRYEGLPWCDIVIDPGNTTLRIYQNYVGKCNTGRIDRVTQMLESGGSVSVSIRKQEGKQISAEVEFDGEYRVHVSITSHHGDISAIKQLQPLTGDITSRSSTLPKMPMVEGPKPIQLKYINT